ncbi:hypothetical protein VaNZ11_011105 [Volvox africanus]|uniref:Calmodulin n=1 Tax=Volvox africanus TaxID=51714 RepID=A0ABQ5SC46_9CHLO|nr:hypothetical protein VaNZ11_011105 [Volvox africanus]
MQQAYEVRFHTGDSWGRGCTSLVAFQVYGSRYILSSESCIQQELPAVSAKRSRAVQFAVGKADSAARKDRGDAAHEAASPPPEKRNVFALLSHWLKTSGGAVQTKQLVKVVDEGGDGLLGMEEVKQLLSQAVPSVSDLETQLFIAMVDANSDGVLTERELLQSVGDCAAIDVAVASGGSGPGPVQDPGGHAEDASSPGAEMAAALAAAVQHLRSNAGAVDSKLLQMSPPGGYLTYGQLNELLQAVVPESLGGRATVRALMAHVARTANVSALDPGVHVLEIKRCFGITAATVRTAASAAVAAGWVPGRPRNIFKLLRYHVKHNRAQLDSLFPRGLELTANQVRHVVRQLLDTRTGEPPLTGREARHLVAALDVNANGTLSREEFDKGLRECRDISAAMTTVYGRGLDPAGLQLDAPLYPPLTGEGQVAPPTWGSFLEALRQLHQLLMDRSEEVEAAWRLNDSRGKGRIDACELRRVLLDLAPDYLRAVLIYLDGWDPSEHGLLSRKHLLTALRGDRPPDSLQPQPVVPLVGAGEGVTATTPPLQGISQGITRALYGGNVDTGLRGLLPDPAQWQEWHGNVKTPGRPSGSVTLGGGGGQLPPRSGFWKAQWKWHTAWLAANEAYRQAATGLPAAGLGDEKEPSAAAAVAPLSSSTTDTAAAWASGPPSNCLECRLWPPMSVAALPYISAVYGNELTAWKRAVGDGPERQGAKGPGSKPAAPGAPFPGPAPPGSGGRRVRGAVAEAVEGDGEGAQRLEDASTRGSASTVPAAQIASQVLQDEQSVLEGKHLPNPGGPAEMAGESAAAAAAEASVPRENAPEANVSTAAAFAAPSEDVSAPEQSVTSPQQAATPVEGIERPAAVGAGEGPPSSQREPLLHRLNDATASRQLVAPEPADVLGPEAGRLPESHTPAAVAAAAELPMTAAAVPDPAKGPLPEAVTTVPDRTSEAVALSSVAMPVATLTQSDTSGLPAGSSSRALPVADDGGLVTPAAAPRLIRSSPQNPSAAQPPQLFQAPPGLVPARVLSYKAILAAGAQLGNVESISVKASSSGPAWYLDKVEVLCPTCDPGLLWEVTVRRWLQPGEQLTGLRPDPFAWEEWDMQAGDSPGAPVLFFNRNLGEVSWTAPPRTPLPALPGAVPNLRLTGDMRMSPSSSGQQSGEWLGGVTPIAVPRNNVRFLDSLRDPPLFRPTRVRATYDLGFDGQLGIVPGQEVRVRGDRCSHSIAVMARGGFKVVDPDDPSAARLLPVGGASTGTTYGKSGGGSTGRPDAAAGSAVDSLGGAVFPGIRECVVLSYALDAAADALGEKYMWLDGWVALDDSAGTPPAPVRFSVVKDGALVWAKWVRAAGEVHRCCVPVVGCMEMHLVVESDFSGGARAVWLDPLLMCGPLHDKALIASLELSARANEVADRSGGDIKVSFVTEDGGAIMYMAPAQSVPFEVSRSSSTASYRISVFTGPGKNGGTRGKVYIRLQGWRGSAANGKAIKSNLMCINPDGIALKEGDKYSLLEPVTLPWMDEVESVVLQHVPAPSGILGGSSTVGGPNDWNIQHVELSCDETGRTWYFVAGGWFLELAGRQAEERGGPRVAGAQLELMLPRAASPNQLKVVFHIISSGKGVGMGIDGDLEMVLVGVDASGYQYASLSLPGRSIDSPHETRLLESPLPLGDLQTVELSCKQQGLLRTRLQFIEVVRLVDAKHFLFLTPSLDPGEPPDAATTRLVLRAATQPYFRISTFTSAIPEASTDARIYIDLFGSRGKLLDLYLRDATGDSFSEGCEDVFFFPDPGLGDLGSVCISHDDSGESPNWHLDRVEIANTVTGRTNVFVCKQWIGLGTNQQDKNQLEGRFGPDRVLERVLYPTHVLTALKDGTPLLRYHVIFHTNNARGELCNTAEALQLVGRQADGVFQYSDLVILDRGRSDMDLELDMQYVRHIQAASRAEAQRGLEDRDSSLPATAVVGNSANTCRTIFQVVIKKLALFQARANIVLQGHLGARQLALVLHGSCDSSRSIILGADNCMSTGMLPFTAQQVDDVFQVSCDTQLGAGLLRVDVQLPSSSHTPPDWGILLESVTIRELSDARGSPTEFFAGSRGQWAGASPDTPEGVVGGTQALHLLPAGCCAASFLGRALQELVAVHLRHDSPAPQSDWDLNYMEVLVSPPSGSPIRGDAGMPGTASMTPQKNGQQSSIMISPCLYHFPGSPQQPCACWPSREAPFIRQFLIDKYLLQPFPPQAYFKAPLIASPQWHESPEPAPLPEVQEGSGAGPAPIDAVAMAALKFTQKPDPERLQALEEEYRAEVAAYLQSLSGPGAAGTDVFTLMRARIRAHPGLLPREFNELDKDKDGKLSPSQVHDLIPHLLPGEVHCSEQLSKYIAAMLTLGSGEMMAQAHIVSALKACRSAYKEAASMVHMLEEGSVDWYQVAQEDGLGVEMALCRLSEQLVQPTNVQAAQEAFQLYDTDGSGYLDIGELCKALQSIPDLRVSSREIRLLLAYLFHFGDKDKDLRLSVLELQTSLAPFVPRPPAEELELAYTTYKLLHNLPALLRVVNKLQPALFSAACAQAKAAAVTAGSSPNEALMKDVDSVLLSLLPDIIAVVASGLEVPPNEVTQLQQLISLDSGNQSLSVMDLIKDIALSADAIKRAMSIARLVSNALEEHEPLALDHDLQSAEVVLHKLAQILVQDDGNKKLAESFHSLDADGSGYLEGPEICAAIRQIWESISKEELRTLLAYIQRYADQDTNGRVSMEELQVLLRPFQ